MKKIYLICGMSLVVTMSSAQGGITTQMLKEIQEAQPKQNIPLTNAIANVSLDDLAKKHRTGIPSGTYFSVSTKSQKISNQKREWEMLDVQRFKRAEIEFCQQDEE